MRLLNTQVSLLLTIQMKDLVLFYFTKTKVDNWLERISVQKNKTFYMNESLVNSHVFRRKIPQKLTASLQTLPVELVYRILDELDDSTLIRSCYYVCTKLNNIIDTYRRYRVNLRIFMEKIFPLGITLSDIDDDYSEISISTNHC